MICACLIADGDGPLRLNPCPEHEKWAKEIRDYIRVTMDEQITDLTLALGERVRELGHAYEMIACLVLLNGGAVKVPYAMAQKIIDFQLIVEVDNEDHGTLIRVDKKEKQASPPV